MTNKVLDVYFRTTTVLHLRDATRKLFSNFINFGRLNDDENIIKAVESQMPNTSKLTINDVIQSEYFTLPKYAFNAIAKQKIVSVSLLELMIEKKIKEFDFIRLILKKCKHVNAFTYEIISNIFDKNELTFTLNDMYTLIQLTNVSKQFEYKNIYEIEIYRKSIENIMCESLDDYVTSFIKTAGDFANHDAIYSMLTAIHNKKIKVAIISNFNSLKQWLKDNIDRYKHDPTSIIGWTCGPDSGPWPSSKIEDYIKTLDIINKITK